MQIYNFEKSEISSYNIDIGKMTVTGLSGHVQVNRIKL